MTIDQLAYLKCPDKIRTAMINTTGYAPSLSAIETRLKHIQRRDPTQYGSPDGNEGVQYRIISDSVDDPLLAALKREHPERFSPRRLEHINRK